MTQALLTIPTYAWDAISPNMYTSFGWTDYSMRQYSPSSVVALAFNANTLVGLLPIHQSTPDDPEAYNFDSMVPNDHEVVYFTGAYRGYENALQIDTDNVEVHQRVILRALFSAANRHLVDASGEPPPLVVPYLTANDAAFLLDTLGKQQQTPLAHSVDARLSLPPDLDGSWDSYLASQTKSHRYRIRRELQSFADDGYRMETVSLDKAAGPLSGLVSDLQRSHGINESATDVYDSLVRQSRALGGQAVTFLTRDKHDEYIAGALFYVHQGKLYGRMAGLDTDRSRGAYFPTYVYAGVRYAVENRLSQVHLGRKSLKAKTLRGGSSSIQWLVNAGGPWAPSEYNPSNADRIARMADEEGVPIALSMQEAQWTGQTDQDGEWHA